MFRAFRKFESAKTKASFLRGGGFSVHGRTIWGSRPTLASGSSDALRRLIGPIVSIAPPLRSGSGGELGIRERESGRGVGTVELIKMTAAGNGILVVTRVGKVDVVHVSVSTSTLLPLFL